jgi:hypothetical protein
MSLPARKTGMPRALMIWRSLRGVNCQNVATSASVN